jgi:hypothetical protein
MTTASTIADNLPTDRLGRASSLALLSLLLSRP